MARRSEQVPATREARHKRSRHGGTRGQYCGEGACTRRGFRWLRAADSVWRLRSKNCKEKPPRRAAAVAGGQIAPPELPGEEIALREDDLDAAVLRLAYAWRCRDAQIVHAATGD